MVFRVDSPGGSAVASEVIRQEMARTAEKLPVVVSMAGVAGSGGYWIACGAQRIVACPSTLTASIGVFGGHLNMDQFWADKLGVTFGRMDKGANANLYGDLEDWTDPQRAIIDRQLDRIYSSFVERVASSRKMSPEAVDAVGRGRVYTGVQGASKGLVDVVGGFDVALAEARQLAGLTPDAPVHLVDFPKVVPWWQRLAQRGREEEATVEAASQSLRQGWGTGARAPGRGGCRRSTCSDAPLPAGMSDPDAAAVRPSVVTLPERPPSGVITLLDFFVIRFPRIPEAVWRERLGAGKVWAADGPCRGGRAVPAAARAVLPAGGRARAAGSYRPRARVVR